MPTSSFHATHSMTSKKTWKVLLRKVLRHGSNSSGARSISWLLCDFVEEDSADCKVLRLSSEENASLYETGLSVAGNACLPVFPQVLSVDNVEDKLVFHGVAILRSQLANIEREIRAEKTAYALTARRRIAPS